LKIGRWEGQRIRGLGDTVTRRNGEKGSFEVEKMGKHRLHRYEPKDSTPDCTDKWKCGLVFRI
jgi:hypothetical protein